MLIFCGLVAPMVTPKVAPGVAPTLSPMFHAKAEDFTAARKNFAAIHNFIDFFKNVKPKFRRFFWRFRKKL